MSELNKQDGKIYKENKASRKENYKEKEKNGSYEFNSPAIRTRI